MDIESGITRLSPSDAEEVAQRAVVRRAVYVYEAPIRAWHWINALAVFVLMATGYLIGKPLPSVGGEASANYVMGYIRFAHFAAAYVFAVGFIGRLYWAFAGNHHSHELFTLPLFNRGYWRGVMGMVRWYLFIDPRPGQYVGHNPLARLGMVTGFLAITVFMFVTGFALYSEGLGRGSWADLMFGWVIPLFGQSQDLHTWHRLGMWGMVIFVLMHVYAAIREDIMGRQSMVSTMISGFRTFKD
ncbi:Ni/Fe-hydrogenase, b-type cytochrome subunit [Rubrivivax gelatinosus]|nr:Ni/Fe-hydrogenase, b-type cytochrome subunit [Rubrivivax gelatinosus]